MRHGIKLAAKISVGTFFNTETPWQLQSASRWEEPGRKGPCDKGDIGLTYRWEICFLSLGSSKGQTQRSEMETPVQGVRVINMRRAPRQLSRGSSKQLSCFSGSAEISTLHLETLQEMGKAGVNPRP